MMGYEKRVVYFDLIERDEKIGNAGFLYIKISNTRKHIQCLRFIPNSTYLVFKGLNSA